METPTFATDEFFPSISKDLRVKVRFNELIFLIYEIFYNYYHMNYFSYIIGKQTFQYQLI